MEHDDLHPMPRWKFVLSVMLFGAARAQGIVTATALMACLHTAGEVAPLPFVASHLREQLPPGPSISRYEVERNLAVASSANDDALGAVMHAQQGLLIARALNDTSRMLGSLYQLTKFSVEGRHYAEADRHRREHLALARNYGKDTKQLALAHNSMGSMHSRLENIDSAEFHYRQGLRVLADSGSVVRQALLGNLASTLGEKGQHDETARLFQQAFAEMDSTELLNKAWTLRNLGQSLMSAERYDEAINTFEEGDSLNRISGNALDLAIDFAELRAECMQATGDAEGAYTMVKLARDLQDTLFDRSMNEQLLELETRFGTKLKEEEIQRLDAQARAQSERLRLRNVQLYGSLVLVALALVGIVLVWRNLRQRRKHAAALEWLNVELQDKQARIEEINGLLRMKVLRTQMDPHFIHNCLNAIRALSMKGDHERADVYLEGFARLLRTVLEHSVRDRITLAEEIAFLQDYVKLEQLRLGDDFSWSITADRSLVDEEPQIPSLLVQPFVENAIWHGLAPKLGDKRLDVVFTEEHGAIVCTVQDNGVGRSEKPHTPGRASLGLQLTGERLQVLTERMESEGAFTIEDLTDEQGKAAGTLVRLMLEPNVR